MIKNLLLNFPNHLSIAREVSKSNDKNILFPIIKMIIARITYGISTKDYALYDFEKIQFKFWKNFANKRTLNDIQNTFNPVSQINIVADKIDFYIRCLQYGLPTPRVWAIICSTANTIRQIPEGVRIIYDKKELESFLYDYKEVPKDLIIKPAYGTYGKGLIALRLKNKKIFDAFDRPVNIDQVYNHFFAKYRNQAFIVQERLKPHPDLKPLMPYKGLGCIRVVTYFSGHEVAILFVFIKIPVGENVHDGFQHGASGNLLAYLNFADGKLGKAWGMKPGRDVHCLAEFTTHPTTGVMFHGFQLPQWDDTLRIAKKGAKAFPELKTIGWDVAICRNGIFLIEGNSRWDPDGPQITLKRGIKKDMMALA